MPSGANPKREREYEELKREFKKEGRYPGREEEVASRIVNKQRRQFGETKSQQKQERTGKAPDKNLPVPQYRHQTVGALRRNLPSLSPGEITRLKDYEQSHKKRRTLLKEFAHALQE
jgi:hypothetical protein